MELFLRNCEATALEVLVERPGAPPEQRRLGRPFVLIGRDSRNDVLLDDDQVSRRHAYVQLVGGRAFCVDLVSRTGVHWPTGPQASGWVEWDEPLRIGRNTIRLARPRPDAGSAARGVVLRAEERMAPEVPDVVIEVDAPAPLRWRMSDSLALAGTAPGCKLRLRHADISRFHCSLVRGPLGVWVVDLLSREGTRVNDHKVPWAQLMDGDRLQIGPFTVYVRYEQPALRRGLAAAPPFAVDRPLSSAVVDQSSLLPVFHEFNRMQQHMMDQFHQTTLMMVEMFGALHREQTALVRAELEEMRRLTQELNELKAEQARQALTRPAAPAAAPEAERPTVAAPPADASQPAPPPLSSEPAGKGDSSAPASPDVHDWLSHRVAALQEERNGRWQKILQFITGAKGA
ncbi:MAG TPA: FHA domain-containing protein [Gemmataceae bacterium]|nr:FHA domain-containing protein [Gemmataceae bacterium]